MNLKGMSRIRLEGEIYTNNGDSHKEIIGKLFVASTSLAFDSPDSATDGKLKTAFLSSSSIAYPASKLLRSMLHIERSTSVTVNTIGFTSNWLLENSCSDQRAQVMTVSEFAGNI